MKKSFLGIAALIFIAGCGGGGSSSEGNEATLITTTVPIKPPEKKLEKSIATTCNVTMDTEGGAINVEGGYSIANHLFWYGSVPTNGFTQCISGKSIVNSSNQISGVAMTASWDWPNRDPDEYHAYPSIVYQPTNTPFSLSVQVKDIGSLTAKHDVSINASGIYDVTYDLWTLDKPRHESVYGVVCSVDCWWPPKAEIMIKFQLTQQRIYPMDKITVEGINYNIYYQKNWSAGAAGGNLTEKWDFVTFEAQQTPQTATVPFKPFFDYLVKIGFSSPDDYVKSLQFGVEISEGKGEMKVNSFSITR